jgi:hypothetical protein
MDPKEEDRNGSNWYHSTATLLPVICLLRELRAEEALRLCRRLKQVHAVPSDVARARPSHQRPAQPTAHCTPKRSVKLP